MTNDILFYGTYQHKVDSKGRVCIPAPFRKVLNDGVFIHKNGKATTQDYIFSFKENPQQGLEDILPNVGKYQVDHEGRICISEYKNCVAQFAGCGNYFEIRFKLLAR